jgi:N-acetylglucosamine malate deacetylase 1
MSRILIIAPHADDEVLGCGATMVKFAGSGDEVFVIIATNAAKGAPELFSKESIATVRSEAEDAHRILGVKETIFMEFPAPALNAFPSYKISLEFSKVFENYRPTHLFLPHPCDLHEDHNAIYRAALVSARPQGFHKISNIYCYETLSETEWSPNQGVHSFLPNHFIEVTDFFSKKIEAMKCFESQMKKFPHSRSFEGITALATLRGVSIGVERAEAFVVERQIN